MAAPRLCSVDGCGKPHVARGCCKSHYNRLMAYGDPLKGPTPIGVPMQWMQEHATYIGDDCLRWPFAHGEDGYGTIRTGKSTTSAHRYMCRLAHGEPDDPCMEVAHSCGNGHLGCVNPRHLRWATRSENCNDRTIHGTQNRGERCGNAKLTEGDVQFIRAMRGIQSQNTLAKQFGVTKTTIYAIQRGKLWGWLPNT